MRTDNRSVAGLLMVLVWMVALPARAQCRVTWWQRDSVSNHTSALVYADMLGQTVLFDHDLWSWDGVIWTHQPPAQPQEPSIGGVISDPVRSRLVALRGPGQPNYGTWEWNGQDWSLVTTQGPLDRERSAAAFDHGRGRVVLVGGNEAYASSALLGDMWEWDGTSWILVTANAVTPRRGHQMAYDEARGKMVLFGGHTQASGNTETRETWEWDGSQWSMVSSTAGLGKVRLHYDSRAGRVIAIETEPTPKLWAWDGAAWTLIDMPTFKARTPVQAAFDRARGVLVVSGGYLLRTNPTGFEGPAADVWEWDGTSWSKVYDNAAPARAFHAMAYDAARHEMIAFGGIDEIDGAALGDTLVFDGEFWQVRPVAGAPARTRATMAYDQVRQVAVLHGGLGAGGQPLRDTWTWNGKAWAQVATDGPATLGPVMVWDPIGARCLAVPGNGEVWAWDGSAWGVVSANGPLVDRHCVAFDTARGRLVVDNVNGFRMGEWDGATWHTVTPQYVRLIWDAAMVYDPRIGRSIRAGGTDAGEAFVVLSSYGWEWDGLTWRFAMGLPSGRIGHAMAWDPDRQRVVCFGGQNYRSVLADTWSSAIAGSMLPQILFPPGPAAAMSGRVATFKVTTIANWWVPGAYGPELFQWYLNGVALTDGPGAIGTVSGSTGEVLSISDITSVAEGWIHVVVSNACGQTASAPASLNVLCPGDMTERAIPGTGGYGTPDGVVNNDDFFYYLARFASGSIIECDLTTTGAATTGQPGYRTPDGVLDRDDFLVYLALFAEGC